MPRNFDPALHLVLDLDPAEMLERQGRPRLADTLKGISGCAIWRIADASGPFVQPRVAAVETSVYDKHPDRVIVRGTSWQVVLRLIHQAHPELRSAFNLVVAGR